MISVINMRAVKVLISIFFMRAVNQLRPRLICEPTTREAQVEMRAGIGMIPKKTYAITSKGVSK